MKIFGWVLLIGGLVSTAGAWQYGFGATGVIIMLIIAAIGAWLAFRGEDAQGQNQDMM